MHSLRLGGPTPIFQALLFTSPPPSSHTSHTSSPTSQPSPSSSSSVSFITLMEDETPISPFSSSHSSSCSSNGHVSKSPHPLTPNPTTFIQADTTSFKKVVQMLTGSQETAAKHSMPVSTSMPPKSPAIGPRKPSFKLYERRGSFRHLKMISPLVPGTGPEYSCRIFSPKALSPSMLDFPALTLSPVTPLVGDPFIRCSEEERAIAEKGFYFHPSPRSEGEPRLLPLFPVTSPRVSAAAGSE